MEVSSAPGSAGFVVSVADVAATAQVFGRTHASAARAVADASGRLAECAAMAGDDPVLAGWRIRYQAVARAAWTAVAAATHTLHDVGAKLVETGDAYLAADHASTPNRSGGPDRLAPVGPVVATPSGPPSATGPTGGEVPARFAEYWPGGDPVRLRVAGSAWTGLASGLTQAVSDADRAFRGLTAHNSGPGFSAMTAFWSSRYVPCAFNPLFNAAPDGAQLLGKTCEDLADLIELTRSRLQNAASDSEDTLVGFDAASVVPGPIGSAAKVIEFLAGPLVEWRFLEDDRQAYLYRLDELTARLSVLEEERLDRAARFPTPAATPGLTLADAGEVVRLGLGGSGWDQVRGTHPTPDSVHITDDRRTHILDGDGPDRRGGGHRAGTGKPEKTEFPPTWTDKKVIDSILGVARDPSSQPPPLLQLNGRYKLTGVRDGVTIVAVVSPDGSVTTGYPESGPGVVRNPP